MWQIENTEAAIRFPANAAFAPTGSKALDARLPAAETTPPGRAGIHLSLRVKGVLAALVLITYLVLIGFIVGDQRGSLALVAHELDDNQATLALLEPAVNGLAHALVDTQAILNTQERPGPSTPAPERLGLEELNLALEQLRAAVPTLDDEIANFRQATGSVLAHRSPQHLASMRDSAQILLLRLQSVEANLQRGSASLAKVYHGRQQFLTIFAISANVLGAVASVTVILVFFTRLARDINRLQARAAAIVAGYDGAPLANTRHDEVGGLIDAVNRMQVDLRRWEQQMELARQQRFHQEKMAAVGSIASAIGHEVRNPIAAISGVAQFIADESAADERPQSRQVEEFARQILVQTERISHILRQLAAVTSPRSPDPELMNLNALVHSTCGFIRYDKRFDKIRFAERLDPSLPAIRAVSDHLMQVLINLLINAADAFDGLKATRDCVIRIETRVDGDEVILSVRDNAGGMTPEVCARAFEESFTTKPAGQGRGIGLFVCKSLIEKGGGRIELTSVPGEGTTATVALPRTEAVTQIGEGTI